MSPSFLMIIDFAFSFDRVNGSQNRLTTLHTKESGFTQKLITQTMSQMISWANIQTLVLLVLICGRYVQFSIISKGFM